MPFVITGKSHVKIGDYYLAFYLYPKASCSEVLWITFIDEAQEPSLGKI